MKATQPNRKIGEMAPKIPPKSAYRISLVIVTGSGMGVILLSPLWVYMGQGEGGLGVF